MLVKLPHIKTNQNSIKVKQVHFYQLLIFFSFLIIYKASLPVENKLCEGSIPNRSQLCQIPCPIDCEVSPWGAWGPCTFENCDDQAGKKGKTTQSQLVIIMIYFEPCYLKPLSMCEASSDLPTYLAFPCVLVFFFWFF